MQRSCLEAQCVMVAHTEHMGAQRFDCWCVCVQIVQLNYPSQDSAKVESAISGGRVLCNGRLVQSLSECVCKGDVLSYTQHRHEPEVKEVYFTRT